MRCIHGQWWNLNSIYPAPEPLSTFYLSAFLGSLQQEGYTVGGWSVGVFGGVGGAALGAWAGTTPARGGGALRNGLAIAG